MKRRISERPIAPPPRAVREAIRNLTAWAEVRGWRRRFRGICPFIDGKTRRIYLHENRSRSFQRTRWCRVKCVPGLRFRGTMLLPLPRAYTRDMARHRKQINARALGRAVA